MNPNLYKIASVLTILLLGTLACGTEAFPAPRPTVSHKTYRVFGSSEVALMIGLYLPRK
jgi:hypothetical protein